MKLMTKEIEEKLRKTNLKTDDYGMDAKVIVKYFNPIGVGTWLIVGGEELENGDWYLFGYCHIQCWEWGPVLLSDLQSLRLPLGLSIERDLHCEGKTVEELS